MLNSDREYHDAAGKLVGTSGPVRSIGAAPIQVPGWWIPFRILWWAVPVILAGLLVLSWLSDVTLRPWAITTLVVALVAVPVCFGIWGKQRPWQLKGGHTKPFGLLWQIRTRDYVAAVVLALPHLVLLWYLVTRV